MTEPGAADLDAAVERFSKMTDAELAAWTEEPEAAARQRGAKPERLADDALADEGRTVPVGMRMPLGLQNAIKEIAGARGVKYQTLIMRWLEEKVADERSEADTVLIRITSDALRRALETGQLALDLPRKAS
jgi:predicted DNA binding CopG/RHH family protein